MGPSPPPPRRWQASALPADAFVPALRDGERRVPLSPVPPHPPSPAPRTPPASSPKCRGMIWQSHRLAGEQTPPGSRTGHLRVAQASTFLAERPALPASQAADQIPVEAAVRFAPPPPPTPAGTRRLKPALQYSLPGGGPNHSRTSMAGRPHGWSKGWQAGVRGHRTPQETLRGRRWCRQVKFFLLRIGFLGLRCSLATTLFSASRPARRRAGRGPARARASRRRRA